MRGIDSPFLRQQAFLVVVRSCFEASVFSGFDCRRTDEFRLTDVRSKDLPNSRLELAVNALSDELFPSWTREYCEDTSEPNDAKAISSALGRKRQETFLDLPLPEADAVLARFLMWLTMRWNGWLAERGFKNGDYEDHLVLVPSLVDDMNQRCSGATVAHPLTATTSPHDSATVLLQQMENEVLRIRESPIPAQIVPISSLGRELWPNLPVGTSPHLFFQARSFDDVCRQHELISNANITDLSLQQLVFLRMREQTGANGVEYAKIFVFEAPAELKELRRVTKDVPAYGLMSTSLAVTQAWMDEWFDQSIHWACKIDHSLHSFLTQHCEKQEQVRYCTSTIRDGDQNLQFICFLTRKADEKHWGLYIGFCSDHSAKTCVQFIEQKMDAGKFVFDREPFQGDFAPLLQVIATHMMRDECFFSFNQLSYS